LLIGTFGATELSARNGSATRPSIGLGGGIEWMATEHIGLRGDLRALLTFSGSGGGSASCGGGCSVNFHGSLVAQGEVSVRLVERFEVGVWGRIPRTGCRQHVCLRRCEASYRRSLSFGVAKTRE